MVSRAVILSTPGLLRLPLYGDGWRESEALPNATLGGASAKALWIFGMIGGSGTLH